MGEEDRLEESGSHGSHGSHMEVLPFDMPNPFFPRGCDLSSKLKGSLYSYRPDGGRCCFFLSSKRCFEESAEQGDAGFLLVSSWFHSHFPFDVVTLSEEFGHIKSDLRPLGTMMALFDAWRRCYELSRCHLDE